MFSAVKFWTCRTFRRAKSSRACLRQAALSTLAALLESEASKCGKGAHTIIGKHSIGYAQILQDMISTLAVSTAPPQIVAEPSIKTGGDYEAFRNDSFESNWDIRLCARCVTAACRLHGLKALLTKIVGIAVGEQRLFQNLIPDPDNCFPEILQLISTLVKVCQLHELQFVSICAVAKLLNLICILQLQPNSLRL